MAQHIKGTAVPNATSYSLHNKTNNYEKLAEQTEGVSEEINFDLSTLSLEPGTYTLVVKAKASGYEDSDYSNEVSYFIPEAPIINLYNKTAYPVQNGYYGNSLTVNPTDKAVLQFSNYRVTLTTGLDVEHFPVQSGKTYSIKLYNAPTTAMTDGSTGTTELGPTEIPYFGIWGLFFYETINDKKSIRYMYTICNKSSHVAYWNTTKPSGYTGSLPYSDTNNPDVFKISKGTAVDKILVTNLTSGAKSDSLADACVFGKDSKYTQSCQVEINDPAITHMTILFGNPANSVYQMKSAAGLLSAEDRAAAIETIQNGLMIVEGTKLPTEYNPYEE